MIILISILFFLFPFLSLPIILVLFFVDKNFKHKRIYVIFLAILASLLLYYFTPDPSKDLFRYYIIMGKLSAFSISEFWMYLTSRVEPVSNIYLYIFSKIGNFNLIMIATTLISYMLIFHVLFDHQKKVKLSNQDFNIILVFMFSVFYLVDDITGIRFCLARIVFFLALYLDMYKNNKKLYVKFLYLLSLLIHSSCVIFIVLRIFLKFIKNRFNIKTFLFLTVLSISPQVIIKMASVASKISFLSTLSVKAEEYLNLNAGFYPMFILQIIVMLFLFIVLIFLKKNCKSSNTIYINYVLLVLSIGLLFVRCTSISTRFIRAAIIFSLPILMDYLKTLKSKNKLVVYIILLVISGVSICFQISHLTVKITYGDLFETGIFKNIISLLLK